MTAVNSFMNEINLETWHFVKDLAFDYPNGSRFLAFPIALATFGRDILVPIAQCIEELMLTAKSIRAYMIEKDPKMHVHKKNVFKHHSFEACKYAIIILFSPLIALIDAIYSCVMMGAYPLKTTKINAAKESLGFLIKYTRYILIEVNFAKSAFNHFKQQVEAAKSQEELKILCFLEGESSVTQVMDDIFTKKNIYDTEREVYDHKSSEINNKGNDQRKELYATLDREWQSFEHQLIKATAIEALTMKFRSTISLTKIYHRYDNPNR